MVCPDVQISNVKEHPGCFIIPPTILKMIAKNGTEKQKKDAERNIESITSIRGRRLSLLRPTMPSGEKTLTTFLKAALNRLVYNAGHGSSLQQELARKEGEGTTGDNDIDKAYAYSGDAYKLFKEAFGRKSIDNNGMSLVSTVHYVEPAEDYYNNASWNGEQMIYGDTDPAIFKTVLLRTVSAHEMGHGVVQYEGGLTYQKDTGAINEHFADVFGILGEQITESQDVDQSNWLIGEGIWADSINGESLRSMSNPGSAYNDPLVGKDPQPKHMNGYVDLPIDMFNDWGGVHINSGIPNCAFYKAAKNLGGYAWETAGPIWNAALKVLPGKPNATTFQDLANTTSEICRQLFENDKEKQDAVYKAWKEVGLEPQKIRGREFINLLVSS